MLPVAITTGILLYLAYHWLPPLRPLGHIGFLTASLGQPILVAVMLFLQFVKVSPRDLKIKPWHLKLLVFQSLTFIALTGLTLLMPKGGTWRIISECAMICFICPTAAAAGVITDRLGGSLSDTISYVVVINAVATVLIPAAIPLVAPSEGYSFAASMWKIACRVFPMLILPCLTAWLVRFTAPRLQKKLEKLSHWSFLVWGVCLTLAMVLSTRALVSDKPDAFTLLGIAAVSLLACAVQFASGRAAGKRLPEMDRITSGQALGQKNTSFLIWLGYSWLTPVTSIAGGLYAIWQNIFNSWELYRREERLKEEP